MDNDRQITPSNTDGKSIESEKLSNEIPVKGSPFTKSNSKTIAIKKTLEVKKPPIVLPRLYGCHIVKEPTYARCLYHCYNNYGGSCTQVFVDGPMTSTQTMSANEKKELIEYIEMEDITLIVHASYLVHLFDIKEKTMNSSFNICKNELALASKIKAKGLNIHLNTPYKSWNLNNLVETERCINHVIKQLDRISDYLGDQILYLEISALKKNCFVHTANINMLFEQLSYKKYSKSIGLCIDTAHLWSSGIDISSRKKAKEWFSALDTKIIRNILIHFNDNEKDLGVCKDKHAEPLCGKIWNTAEGLDSIEYIFRFADENKAPLIFECEFVDFIQKHTVKQCGSRLI